MSGVVSLCWVQYSGVEASWRHCPVVLPLAVIAANCIVTCIHDNVDWIPVIVVDGVADRGVLSQAFDIVKGFLFHWDLPEFCALPGEVR